MTYILSRKAEEDIVNIYIDGFNRFGLLQADTYYAQLEQTFIFLSNNPEAARLRYEIKPAVRIHPFQSHIIIYSIDENNAVFIIRVRHSREDWLCL